MRIISLVPSITETLIDLAPEMVVGRTKFCIHPADFVKKLPVVGGTKSFHTEKVRALKPDLVIANKEENEKEFVEELMKDLKVWVTNIETLDDNYSLIRELGEITNQQQKAEEICQKTISIFKNYKLKNPVKAAYMIWRKPYMTVGGDNFVNHLLETIGFENIFKDRSRYPEIILDELCPADSILLSTEPYPFSEKHIPEFKNVHPNKKVRIVDGEAFAWYGSRLSKLGNFYKELVDDFNND